MGTPRRHGSAPGFGAWRDGRTTAETVLEQARHISADLIVAGAYGHSRLLEWLVGGMTRELLAQTPIPILMAH